MTEYIKETVFDCFSEWIPCSEMLPVKYDNYLITTGKGDTDIGTFYPEFKRWYICDADGLKQTDDVIAWMPRPYEGNADE